MSAAGKFVYSIGCGSGGCCTGGGSGGSGGSTGVYEDGPGGMHVADKDILEGKNNNKLSFLDCFEVHVSLSTDAGCQICDIDVGC